MRREAERMTSFTLIRVRKRGMMGSGFSLLFFFKAGVKQVFFFPLAAHRHYKLQRAGNTTLNGTGFSRRRLLMPVASLVVQQALGGVGFSTCSTQAQYLRCMGLVAHPACPESFQDQGLNWFPCTGRADSWHWITREVRLWFLGEPPCLLC